MLKKQLKNVKFPPSEPKVEDEVNAKPKETDMDEKSEKSTDKGSEIMKKMLKKTLKNGKFPIEDPLP